jgi:hypothetical protein
MNKWECIKLDSFCTAKEIVIRFNTDHRMRENLCQLFIQLRTNIPILKGTQKTQPQWHPRWQLGHKSRQHELWDSKTSLRHWSHTWWKQSSKEIQNFNTLNP